MSQFVKVTLLMLQFVKVVFLVLRQSFHVTARRPVCCCGGFVKRTEVDTHSISQTHSSVVRRTLTSEFIVRIFLVTFSSSCSSSSSFWLDQFVLFSFWKSNLARGKSKHLLFHVMLLRYKMVEESQVHRILYSFSSITILHYKMVNCCQVLPVYFIQVTQLKVRVYNYSIIATHSAASM